MKRIMGMLLVVLLATAGCGDADKDSDGKVTLTVWTAWSGDSLDDWQTIMDRFEEAHPGVTVKVTPGIADPAQILAAVTAGNPPDMVTGYKDEELGKYCSTGAWQDLNGRIEDAGIDMEATFPAAAISATQFEGRTCGLPYIADAMGLYYNKKLLRAAGFTAPPKTFDELTTMAKALTEFNPDGSIKVAGFVPLINWYENYLLRFPGLFAADYFDEDGRSALAGSSDWRDYLMWQRDLVDFYGYDKLQRFTATAGDEWTADNAFGTGKVAMLMDGEWRTQALGTDAPDLDYGTAPMPVSAAHADLYGAGAVNTGFGLIPRGAEHADLAWDLLRFLATDDSALIPWVNRLQNIPTTLSAASSADLELDPKMKPMIDIYANPASFGPTVRKEGAIFFPPIDDFVQRWQKDAIAVGDLDEELAKLDDQVDAVLAQGS